MISPPVHTEAKPVRDLPDGFLLYLYPIKNRYFYCESTAFIYGGAVYSMGV